MAWGGLRGAVSLALALMVSQHPSLPEALRQQMLLVTTGVVFLTIVINGSTVAWLLHALGLDSQSPTEKASILGVQSSLLADVDQRLRKLALQPEMAMVPWDDVHKELTALHASVEEDRRQQLNELANATVAEQCIVLWHQTLSIERQAYWEAFSGGILSREGIRIFDHALALHFDALALGDTTPPNTRLLRRSSLRLRLLNRIAKGKLVARWHFEELALRYDLARAQLVASQKVVLQMDQLHKGADAWQAEVRNTYLSYQRSAKEAIEDLRSSLPEVAHAIELRLARRIRLNLELDGYYAQRRSGAMEASVAQTYIAGIETQMKELLHAPQRESLPETADVVCHLPLFRNLDAEELAELAVATEVIAFSAGQVLIQEGDESDCMFIIARGAAHVVKQSRGKEILLDTLGGGDIVGETALLTGEPRNATVVAVTTMTVGRVKRVDFDRIMSGAPSLRASVWSAFASHRFHNLVRRDWRFSHLSHDAASAWLSSGSSLGELKAGEVADPTNPETGESARYLFLASGSIDVSGSQRAAPVLLGVEERSVYRVVEPAYVLRIGSEPAKVGPTSPALG